MTRLEHVGIAIEEVVAFERLLSKLLGLETYKVELVASESVETRFLAAGDTKLELLRATDSSSPIARFLEKRGEGLHHLAFEVDQIEDVFARAIQLGLHPLNDEPKNGADGKRIFFLHPKETHGVLVEICQSTRFPGTEITVPMPHGALRAFVGGNQHASPVLLIHDAGGSTSECFGSIVTSIEPSVYLIGFDAPGHGESAQWANNSHFLRAADKHARAILDYFEVESATVVGYGLGAAVALVMAANYPDRVNGLALIDPNLLDSESDIAQAAESIASDTREDSLLLTRTLVSTLPESAKAIQESISLDQFTHSILMVGLANEASGRIDRLSEQIPTSAVMKIPSFATSGPVLSTVLVEFVASLQV